jgi:hypothetical protein
MPHDASTLSDVRRPFLTLVCEPCDGENDNAARLKDRHGTKKLLYLLAELSNDCPKRQSFNVYDRCKAAFEGRS